MAVASGYPCPLTPSPSIDEYHLTQLPYIFGTSV